MNICPLCEATHDSVSCDDRDMTIIGLCLVCLGVMRECYRHCATPDLSRHLRCVGRPIRPQAEYDEMCEKVAINKTAWDKLLPIPSHVTLPEDKDTKNS